jgi:DNA-binding transcriptional ArsR family regulator
MGQPTRLGIIELLYESEMTVSEIADHLKADVTSVSKHLALLRGVGIVRSRKEGLTAYCALVVPQLIAFVRCVDGLLDRRVISRCPEGVLERQGCR